MHMNEPLDASSQTKPRLAQHLALRKGKILDVERITYLKAYISAPCEAVNAGAGVRGYFVWTLLDNFELGAGYPSRPEAGSSAARAESAPI